MWSLLSIHTVPAGLRHRAGDVFALLVEANFGPTVLCGARDGLAVQLAQPVEGLDQATGAVDRGAHVT
jgi:hypothetical protein